MNDPADNNWEPSAIELDMLEQRELLQVRIQHLETYSRCDAETIEQLQGRVKELERHVGELRAFVLQETKDARGLHDTAEQDDDEGFDAGFYQGRTHQCIEIRQKIDELFGA
jgi:hypothetical protein